MEKPDIWIEEETHRKRMGHPDRNRRRLDMQMEHAIVATNTSVNVHLIARSTRSISGFSFLSSILVYLCRELLGFIRTLRSISYFQAQT